MYSDEYVEKKYYQIVLKTPGCTPSQIKYKEAERIIRELAQQHEAYAATIRSKQAARTKHNVEKKTVAFGTAQHFTTPLIQTYSEGKRDPALPPCSVCDNPRHIARDCVRWVGSQGTCCAWFMHELGIPGHNACKFGTDCKWLHKRPPLQPTYTDCLAARAQHKLREEKRQPGPETDEQAVPDHDADSVETQRTLPSTKPQGPRKALAAFATAPTQAAGGDSDPTSDSGGDDDACYDGKRAILWSAR